MQSPSGRLLTTVVLAILAAGAWSAGDPPYRVGRLGYLDGNVGFSPAGEDEWEPASLNRPLTLGDRLWTGERSRAEVQLGGALIRMDETTGVSVLALDDETTQLRLTQGRLNVRVLVLGPGQVIEIDTPNVALVLRQPGDVRIDVDRDGMATMLMVRDGQGDVYGDGAAYVVDSRSGYRFTGTDLREFRFVDAPPPDEFDDWSRARDRRYDESVSARYVSADVVGYQDLDAGGSWAVDSEYGNVWYPSHVGHDWAPYRDGRWTWIEPWGWTWIDERPWGFAVSHYGRWAHVHDRWGWVPGPVRERAYYAPALVVFLGGSNFRISISTGSVDGVAWFPLGPREIYRPGYPVSRRYFERVNRGNTVVSRTIINNYYNQTNITNVVHANRRVGGAVVAVPAAAFVRSDPVSRAAVAVSRQNIVAAPLTGRLALAPARERRSVAERSQRPGPDVFERPVVARKRPPATPAAPTERQRRRAAGITGMATPAPVAERTRPPTVTPAVVKVIAGDAMAPPTQAPPGIDRRPPNRGRDRDPAAAPGNPDSPQRTGERERTDSKRRAVDDPATPDAALRRAPPVDAAAPVPVAPGVGGSDERGANVRAVERPTSEARPTVPQPRRQSDAREPRPDALPPPAVGGRETPRMPTATGQPAAPPQTPGTAVPATRPSPRRQSAAPASMPEGRQSHATEVLANVPTATGQVPAPAGVTSQPLPGTVPAAIAAPDAGSAAQAVPDDRYGNARRKRDDELTRTEDDRRAR